MNSQLVRRLTEKDVPKVAEIHAEAFSRQGHSAEWIRCHAQAFPRMRYYVAESDGLLCAFVLWTEKSGFRENVVLELEQIAVAASYRKQGVAEALIVQSLPDVTRQLAVPYVEEDDYYFLKTVIPSRKATREKLIKGDPNAET